ncbi:hypothetical protein [Pigmentiphaga litoralis]|uniref:hypothetical protein n=1 Tax=Pigmentiphaga litoralis TaxID=516702 RepID=UPI003B433A32
MFNPDLSRITAPASVKDEGALAPSEEKLKAAEGEKNFYASPVQTRAEDEDIDRVERQHILDLRSAYAERAYRFVGWSVVGLFAVICLDLLLRANLHLIGLLFSTFSSKALVPFQGLDKTVVIALISGVTVNVVTVFLVVVRNLFPTHKKQDSLGEGKKASTPSKRTTRPRSSTTPESTPAAVASSAPEPSS